MSQIGKLSVVIIGRNEGPRLARCLVSVCAMHNAGWESEYIYVDSGSTDDSLEIAAEHGFRVLELTGGKPTAARGRNAGWRAATGDVVLFLDGDTVLDREFVATAAQALVEPTTAVVWGHRRELYPEQSIYNRVMDLDWIYAPGWTPFCGGDALFRRDVLAAVDGFDETLIAGEEPELCRRILAHGGRILHIDVPMTKHDLALRNFKPYWARAERAGHAYAEVAARFAASGEPFWQDEVARNRKRAMVLLAAPVAGLLLSVALRSWWPIVLVLLAYVALVLRTAWKARWKSKDAVTLLLYGVHSHLQQIPIFFGQLRFARNRRKGVRSELIEYK
ncbi:glycosyltransferase family 2 protein [Granulicella cerasi]|uniref:Glycosyltransferase family 2 protein n=1 Tax=Granulicella cerasi TaxID=741063 RepID=A0ABW1ZBN0_9BACT|nr:glycosyltransferase [Granulicella cerasi]